MTNESENNKVTTYKGFDKDLKCRGFQFGIGKEYAHDGKVEACNSGFHGCEYPLDVFCFYPPCESRYALVEQSGTLDRHNDGKVASSRISVRAEVSIGDVVKASIDFIAGRIDAGKTESNTGDYSAASNTGDYSAASNTGDWSAASNTGDYSAASNTGDRSAASNTGYYSEAEVSGKESIACGLGIDNKARAAQGSWIVLVFRTPEGEIKHVKSAKAGVTKGVKPDVWYKLDDKGEFVAQ